MPITDDFNRGSIGSNWEGAGNAVFTIASNQCQTVTGFFSARCRRTESSFPNDQYAQAKCQWLFNASGSSKGGTAVRTDSSGNCYYAQLQSNEIELYKKVAGTTTFITGAAVTAATGTLYTVKIEAIGTTIKIYFEGVEKISQTDSALTTGKPGLHGFTGDAGMLVFDDFECTDATVSETYPAGYLSVIRINPLIRL